MSSDTRKMGLRLIPHRVVLGSIIAFLFVWYTYTTSTKPKGLEDVTIDNFSIEKTFTRAFDAKELKRIRKAADFRQQLLAKLSNKDTCYTAAKGLANDLQNFEGEIFRDLVDILCKVEPHCYKVYFGVLRKYLDEGLLKDSLEEPHVFIEDTKVKFSELEPMFPVLADYVCSALKDPIGLY